MTAGPSNPETPSTWNMSIPEAIDLQKRLAGQVRIEPLPADARLIAGADVSILKARNRAHRGCRTLGSVG